MQGKHETGEDDIKVYISGPITGNPDYEDDFGRAWVYLNNKGHAPISPVDIGRELKEKLKREPTWSEYMREDIKALIDCDAIYMLKDWHKSDGARIELELAEKLGLRRFYLD